jgi:hypothetical protein
MLDCEIRFLNSICGMGGGVQLGPLARRPPIVLFYLPRVIMRMENFVEWWLAEGTEVLAENLPQCHIFRHKSHMNWPGANPDRRGGKSATNRLNYGTASEIPCKWLLRLSFHWFWPMKAIMLTLGLINAVARVWKCKRSVQFRLILLRIKYSGAPGLKFKVDSARFHTQLLQNFRI